MLNVPEAQPIAVVIVEAPNSENDYLNDFLNIGCSFVLATNPILALNCRLQVEQVNVVGPLVLALRSLRFLSASQI